MNKLRMAFFAIVGVLAMAAPTLAQGGAAAADNAESVNKYKAIAAGLGFALSDVRARHLFVRLLQRDRN